MRKGIVRVCGSDVIAGIVNADLNLLQKPDIGAPGGNIVSAWIANKEAGAGAYQQESGTSYARIAPPQSCCDLY